MKTLWRLYEYKGDELDSSNVDMRIIFFSFVYIVHLGDHLWALFGMYFIPSFAPFEELEVSHSKVATMIGLLTVLKISLLPAENMNLLISFYDRELGSRVEIWH